MWKTKFLVFLLLTVFTVDLGAIPDAKDRKTSREARKQERMEKREARKANAEQVNLQDVVVTQASPQETAPVSEESIPEDVALNNVVLAEEVVEEPYYEETTTNASAVEPKTTSSKEDNSWLFFLIIAVVLLVSFIKWLNSRRCPRCRKRFAMVAIDENFHGFGKENGKTCNKMKVTRQCKYCGFQDYVVEKRQFDK